MSKQTVYERPSFLTDVPFHYCPGCTHGLVHRLVAEVLSEKFQHEDVIGVAPVGCSKEVNGNPIHVCEMLATLNGPSFIARVSVHDVQNVRNAKRAIAKAFDNQAEKKGFSLIEVLSTCPTNWGKTPEEALKFVAKDMVAEYPLGTFKEV